MPSRSTSSVRLALAFNLVFSASCAATLLLAGPGVGQALGGFPNWFMTALGAGLAGFVMLIAYALARLRIAIVLLISAMDLVWVVGTLPLLAIPGLLSTQGAMIVVAVAAAVGLAALLQLRGVKAMLRVEDGEPDMYRHCVVLKSEVDAGALWAVVRKLDSISLYSDALKSSHMVAGDGAEPVPGAVRVCTNSNDQSWSEELISIDEKARSFVLRFCSEADDFPFPFRNMSGGWTVKPQRGGGSTVEVWWRVRPLQDRLGWLLLAVATIALDRDIRAIVAAMESGGGRGRRRASALPPLAYC